MSSRTISAWSAEYQTIFSVYEGKKAGVCILFNNHFNLRIERTFVDPPGHFIICDIKANDKSLTLANIYTPNDDNPAFFLDLFGHLETSKCDDIIIGGDLNLVLDLEKDKSGGLHKMQQNCLKIIFYMVVFKNLAS